MKEHNKSNDVQRDVIRHDVIRRGVAVFPAMLSKSYIHERGGEMFEQSQDRSQERSQTISSELVELRQALVKSQADVHSARNVVRKLESINTQLRRELTRLEQSEAAAVALACYDELTGLPNRRLLRDRLSQAIAQGIRQDKQVALLMVDLDAFKSVNDRLGHVAGDKLLQALAGRLTDTVRAGDTACRYGGDEFVVMLPAIDHPSLASGVAEKLRRRLSEPYFVDEFEIRITASIGSAFYPIDGRTYEELISRADDALYRAKTKSTRDATIILLPDEIVSAPASPET
jgi:diguanylate cyclase